MSNYVKNYLRLPLETEESIKVIFRKEKETGELLAIFPEKTMSYRGYNKKEGEWLVQYVCSYAHIRQHSDASVEWVKEYTEEAYYLEYLDLLEELGSVYEGTILHVIKLEESEL